MCAWKHFFCVHHVSPNDTDVFDFLKGYEKQDQFEGPIMTIPMTVKVDFYLSFPLVRYQRTYSILKIITRILK